MQSSITKNITSQKLCKKLTSKLDIIDRRSDVVRRMWHLRRNRKRKAFETINNETNVVCHPVLVKGHKLIQSIGMHAKFDKILTHNDVFVESVENPFLLTKDCEEEEKIDFGKVYNSSKIYRLPRALLKHIFFDRTSTPEDEEQTDNYLKQLGGTFFFFFEIFESVSTHTFQVSNFTRFLYGF